MTQRQKGALYMILSALCFASMQVVVRLSREIPTMEQIFMRNSFVLIVSAIIILRKKGSLFGPAKYQPYLFGRSFFGFLGLITLFYASSHAAQGDVTILNKTSPIWVTILAVIFMKEKLPKIRRWHFPWWVPLSCSAPALSPTPSRWWWHFCRP